MTSGALEAVDRVLNRGGEHHEVLHAVVGTLVERGGCAWAAILFVENGELVAGPHAGEERRDARVRVPVLFGGTRVAELVADGCENQALIERVALLVSPYCRRPNVGGLPGDARA